MAKFRGETLSCIVCQSEFRVPPSRALTAKTCSKDCADKVRGEGIKRKVTAICKMCGGHFDIPQSHSDRRVFCSNACREAHPETVQRKKSKTGSSNPMWKGGRTVKSDGYIYALAGWHPFATKSGYVLEHRLIMERHLLQNDPASKFLCYVNGHLVLSPDYHVHHKDHVKSNNKITNLQCMTPSEHALHHAYGEPEKEQLQ